VPKSKPALSVVIPCYNEQDAIADTVTRITDTLADTVPFELIIVDDGSTDGTSETLTGIAADQPALRLSRHERNRGYGAALKTGIAMADAEMVVITDADGTYPIDRIPDLLDAADGFDMVVGARTGESVDYPFIRRIPKLFLAGYASWIVGERIPDINSGLRLFRKSAVERYLHLLPNTFSFTTTITIAMLTDNRQVRFVPINYHRRVGHSKIQPIRDTLRFFHLILRTGIYFAPLRAFAPIILGFGLGFLASLFHDLFVIRDITDKTLILLTFTLNLGLFALLADLIDKRMRR